MGGQLEAEPARDLHLVDVTGDDVLERARDRVQELLAREG